MKNKNKINIKNNNMANKKNKIKVVNKVSKKAKLVENLFHEKELKKLPTRNGYGEGVAELGAKDKNVVVLCADLVDSTRSKYFADKFPERFIEIGVAEQNLVTVASGLAAVGKIPYVSSYAMFCPGRCWEQIRTTICYNDRNVKIVGAHAGISVGPDGATHQATEDIGLMRALPNMKVVVPCDVEETRKATIAIGKDPKPWYIRFARNDTPVFTTKKTPFKLGRAEIFREGKDIAIIACGPLVYEALQAAETLWNKYNIDACVVNNHTIKPLDEKTILNVAKKCRKIVTVEEHQIHTGMGSAVAEFLSQNYPVPIAFVGIKNHFGESGDPEELLRKFGLTREFIVKEAMRMIK